MARLDAFARGAICALRAAGAKRDDIAKKVRKKDGKRPSLRAVDAVLAKHKEDPSWRGDDSRAGGRPRALRAWEGEGHNAILQATSALPTGSVQGHRQHAAHPGGPALQNARGNTVRRL